MAAKTATRAMPDTYFELVKRFPLIRIRDARHLAAAGKVIDDLLRLDLDEGGEAYLDTLSDLVEAYEDAHAPIRDVSGADALRELMRANGLSQTALAKKARIAQSTISAVLSGNRRLTRHQMVKLAGIFRVSPAAFLSA